MKIRNVILFTVFFISFNLFGEDLKEKSEKIISEVFGEVSVSLKELALAPDERLKIEEEAGQRFLGKKIYYYEISRKDSILGVTLLDNVMGRTQPISYLLIISADGKILYMEILKYRSSYGGEVRERGWLESFEGMTLPEEAEIGDKVEAISGATISSKSLTRGVKRLLILFDKAIKGSLN